MAEEAKDVPFSVENAKKEDALQLQEQEHLNLKEAYLELHIKVIDKYFPGRMEILKNRTAVWESISDIDYVEKERRFHKMMKAQQVVQHLTEEKTRLEKDLTDTKLYKEQFLDSGNTSFAFDVKAKGDMGPQAGQGSSST